MSSTMTIFQTNWIEKVPLANFLISRQNEAESGEHFSTKSLNSITLFTPSTKVETVEVQQVQNAFSAINLWRVKSYDNRKNTSWMPLKDEIDELRELAIKSLCHSADIKIEFTSGLLNFCYRYRLMEYLKISLELIKSYFPNYEKVSADLVEDMESDEKWILINIFVKDEVDRILNMYNKYTDEWIERVPWPECTKIRFSYYPI